MSERAVRVLLFALSALVVVSVTVLIHFPVPQAAPRSLTLHLIAASLAPAPKPSPQAAPSVVRHRRTMRRQPITNREQPVASTRAAASPKPKLPAEVPASQPPIESPASEGAKTEAAATEATGAGTAATEPDGSSGDGDGESPASENAASAQTAAESLSSYRQKVYSLIAAKKRYPAIARRMGHTGKVGIAFRLDRQGKLLATSVKASSGFSELDDAALASVRAVDTFPPFPAAIKQDELDFAISLVFELE